MRAPCLGAPWLIAPLLVSLAAEASSGLERSVEELVDRLQLPRGGADPGTDVGLSVLATPISAADEAHSREEITRLLTGLLIAKLTEAGFSSIHVLDAASSLEPLSSLDGRAREMGAEMLLLVQVEAGHRGSVGIAAELRAIDPGLWTRPPIAEHTPILRAAQVDARVGEEIDRLLSGTSIGPADPRAKRVRFEAAPIKIGSLEGRILALASCEVAAGRPHLIFALARDAIHAYLFEKGALHESASLDLRPLPRSPEPAREPIGALACTPRSDLTRPEAGLLLAGVSDLQNGISVRASLSPPSAGRPGGGIDLQIAGEVPGIPIGYLPGARMLIASLDGGRSRWSRVLRLEGHRESSSRTLESALIELAIEPRAPQGSRVFGVSEDYRLLDLGDDLERAVPITTSGVGIAIVPHDHGLAIIATSSEDRGSSDELRLIHLGGGGRTPSLEIAGGVQATALSRLRDPSTRDLIVAAWRKDLARTDLLRVPLGGSWSKP